MLSTALALLIAAFAPAAEPLGTRLEQWGISLGGTKGFTLKEGVSGPAGGVSELEAVSGKRVIRITRLAGLGAEDASRYIEQKRAEILAMYDRPYDGYFAPQAKGQPCPSKMKPALKERRNGGTEVKGLVAMANDRLVTGICLKEQAKFRLVLALAYCAEKKEIFDVRYFSPLKSFSESEESAVLSLKCAN